ncbi:hypothetical protein [Halotalea alkalilenta]|uniref:hypothetical protein n=1 Tax=Halotalea alkalilenta TaxID=376489 RepID=UPI000ACB1B56|nr:hypothetical protein [Halotalea alkalilenta]
MNMTEMGEVVAFLLRYRTAESHPAGGRKRRGPRVGQLSERDVCALLNGAEEHERTALAALLEGFGLRLTELGAGDYPGIQPGARVYLLLPDPEAELPPLFSLDPSFAALRLRQESKGELAQWFLQLWMLTMTLLYTRCNRAPSDVSRYQEATFCAEELVELTREQLEYLRGLGERAPRSSRVLLEERGEDLARRVRGFIELLARAGHLEHPRENESAQEVWQQTLLGAVEVASISVHHLRHLIEATAAAEEEHPLGAWLGTGGGTGADAPAGDSEAVDQPLDQENSR